jgi:WD40 repeat protein
VAWSPDGSALCSVEDDGSLRWYDASGAEQRAVKAHDKAVWALGWAPDGTRLATGSRDQLVRWWSRSGERVAEWAAPSGVPTLAFHPRFEGRVAVGGSEISLVSGSESPGLVAVLRTHEEGDGGFLFAADRSAVELVGTQPGPARETLRCRIGASVYVFELCAGRFELPGLVGAVFSDDVLDGLL